MCTNRAEFPSLVFLFLFFFFFCFLSRSESGSTEASARVEHPLRRDDDFNFGQDSIGDIP